MDAAGGKPPRRFLSNRNANVSNRNAGMNQSFFSSLR